MLECDKSCPYRIDGKSEENLSTNSRTEPKGPMILKVCNFLSTGFGVHQGALCSRKFWVLELVCVCVCVIGDYSLFQRLGGETTMKFPYSAPSTARSTPGRFLGCGSILGLGKFGLPRFKRRKNRETLGKASICIRSV